MIPRTLNEWTVEVIQELLIKETYETEYFDFKEMLPHKQDDQGKRRLVETCCAFANNLGGFLVFGITNDRSMPPMERLVGLDKTKDFPEHFGNFPQKVTPSIDWNFKNPPLNLKNGNCVHIVHIPKSWNAPHCYENLGQGKRFLKRTNKGDEEMSYEEVRTSFLGFYEKRLKLQLLFNELGGISWNANALMVDKADLRTVVPSGDFSLHVLESVLSDTYAILAQEHELMVKLSDLRLSCRLINQRLTLLYSAVVMPIGDYSPMLEQTNVFLHERCPGIVKLAEESRNLLIKFLKDK